MVQECTETVGELYII